MNGWRNMPKDAVHLPRAQERIVKAHRPEYGTRPYTETTEEDGVQSGQLLKYPHCTHHRDGFLLLIRGKVAAVNTALTSTALLFVLSRFALCQIAPPTANCSSLRYSQHKVSCLCGEVRICSGDVCGRPTDYGLDENIGVELRDRTGTTILESKKAVVETRERKCTRDFGTKTFPCNTEERAFCFEGKRDGYYQLAFILFKNGVPQPAVIFPTKYRRKGEQALRLCVHGGTDLSEVIHGWRNIAIALINTQI
jgi:hypothetical protein